MIKKFLAALFGAFLCFCFAGCNTTSKNGTPVKDEEIIEDNKEQEKIEAMFITIHGNKLKVTLTENAAVTALIELLKKEDIVFTVNDYGGFEKVGALGYTLPADDSLITTEAGDVILYSQNQIVLFYGTNTWSYTLLGKIEGYTKEELRLLLGAGKGELQVCISLT